MNPASNAPLPEITDPVIAVLVAKLQQENAAYQQENARYKQSISIYAMKVLKLEQELRLERIHKYGKPSEKLSDLQLLDLEPGVSSVEVEAESEREPLPQRTTTPEPSQKQTRARQQHPGRNEFAAHLERVEEVIVPTSGSSARPAKA